MHSHRPVTLFFTADAMCSLPFCRDVFSLFLLFHSVLMYVTLFTPYRTVFDFVFKYKYLL